MASGDITITTKISGTLTSGDAIRTYYETLTFTSIADIIDRTLTVPTSEVTVVLVGTVAGATLGTVNCIHIHNNDATNFVEVGWIETGAQSAYHKLEAGESITLMSPSMIVDAVSGAVSGTFADLDKVTLMADTGACICQVVAF